MLVIIYHRLFISSSVSFFNKFNRCISCTTANVKHMTNVSGIHEIYRSSGRRHQYHTWKVLRLRHRKEMNWKLIYIHSFDAALCFTTKHRPINCVAHCVRDCTFSIPTKYFLLSGFTPNIQSKYISFISPLSQFLFPSETPVATAFYAPVAVPSQKISVERAVHAKFSVARTHRRHQYSVRCGDCLFHPWIPLHRHLQTGQIIKQDTRMTRFRCRYGY